MQGIHANYRVYVVYEEIGNNEHLTAMDWYNTPSPQSYILKRIKD